MIPPLLRFTAGFIDSFTVPLRIVRGAGHRQKIFWLSACFSVFQIVVVELHRGHINSFF